MSNFVTATEGHKKGSVHFYSEGGNSILRFGGSLTWRHNNIASLPPGISAAKNGMLGVAYGLAVFSNKENGRDALRDELLRSKHQSISVGKLIDRFIPHYIVAAPTDDDYGPNWLEPETGMAVNEPIENIEAFIRLIEQKSEWIEGSEEVYEEDDIFPKKQVITVSGTNVLINGRTAVHRGSAGILNTVDVCLTKIGKSVVPIPYNNVAESKDAAATAQTVIINGNPACHTKSNFRKSRGDEPGNRKGVSSRTQRAKAEFLTGSTNVLIEGKPAVRQRDLMVSNNKNTSPMSLIQPGAPMPTGLDSIEGDKAESIGTGQSIKIKWIGGSPNTSEKLDF